MELMLDGVHRGAKIKDDSLDLFRQLKRALILKGSSTDEDQ